MNFNLEGVVGDAMLSLVDDRVIRELVKYLNNLVILGAAIVLQETVHYALPETSQLQEKLWFRQARVHSFEPPRLLRLRYDTSVRVDEFIICGVLEQEQSAAQFTVVLFKINTS